MDSRPTASVLMAFIFFASGYTMEVFIRGWEGDIHLDMWK